MDTIVLKFGGSSVADDSKLKLVAEKIIDFYNKDNRVIVVVSAQGKTTDNLINEAKRLSKLPNERELDVLLSTGEQISMSKLAILLNEMGYKSISLTGMQAGILTSLNNQNAIIENINITRIKNELDKGNIVIIAGFQGFNKNNDITTLGRGGSDTTAVAIASAISAKKCYIFSDVEGVYTADPNKITNAKKLKHISYDEMLEIANEGARVLHNRCIEVGKKYNIPIIAKSTFNNNYGTVVNDKIEDVGVKSIVKNDDLIFININYPQYTITQIQKLIKILNSNNIILYNFINNSLDNLNIKLVIKKSSLDKFNNIIEKEFKEFNVSYLNISKISVVGNGITNDNAIIEKIIEIIELNNLEILNLEITEFKISIIFNNIVSNLVLEQIHSTLIM